MSFYNGILNYDDIHGSGQIGPRGLPGIGFNLDSNNDYDMQNKKLVNVKNGDNGSDAVTKSQLDTKTSLLDGARTHGYIVNNKAVIYSQGGAVHAKSFYLQDQNEDEVRILTDNQDFDNVHLFVPNLKNFDGFGGRKRSEIMVTSVDQIISGNKFFQNIKAPNPTEDGDVANKNYVDFENTKQNVLIDNEFVKKSGSLMTGDLILPHYNYPVQGNTNKAISYETQREIFISRKETFPMETSIDMNNNVIENIAEATSDHHALRKSQLDNALVIVNNNLSDKADLSKTTIQTFQGRVQVPDFNSGGHNGSDIVNLRYIDGIFLNKKTVGTLNNPITFLSSLPSNQRQIHNIGSPQFNSSAANKQYVDGEIGKIASVDTTQFIKKDGSVPMAADLDMGTQKIENVKTPTNDTDVATKGYIDNTLAESHLTTSHQSNEFKYLDDPSDTSSEYNITVEAFTDFNESPHKNKKAFQITLQKDAGTNNYPSRMGFNLYPLPLGIYTMIFEYFFLRIPVYSYHVRRQQRMFTNKFKKILLTIQNYWCR